MLDGFRFNWQIEEIGPYQAEYITTVQPCRMV